MSKIKCNDLFGLGDGFKISVYARMMTYMIWNFILIKIS
jgi:hypothetical protein